MDDSERFEDPDTLVTCPNDPSHVIRKSKLARHFVKCRPKEHLVKCPFNSTHLVPSNELRHHETICSNRDQFYLYTHKTADNQNSTLEELNKNTMRTPEIHSEENWDNEITEVTRENNLVERCRRNGIERGALQSNSNEKPAQRKILIQEQRKMTRERMNAEEERKRMQLMSQNSNSADDSNFIII